MQNNNPLWHPCTQMHDCETFPPPHIVSAQGSYLQLASGQKIIDAISSWWCKLLGHGEPRIKQALIKQTEMLEHTLLGHATHDTIEHLSQALTKLSPHLNKVFYASDGSVATEIAMKMSVQAQQLRGQAHRTQFAALQHSYHGETGLALAVSDLGLYRETFQSILMPTHFMQDIPYVNSPNDQLWQDCGKIWAKLEAQLNPLSDQLAAIIIEPLLQGAGGMRIYSQDLLPRLSQWARQHDVYLIADEILTGLGRLGTSLACQLADIEPDFICLGKGLTGGWLPMSAVLTKNEIYDLFYDDYSRGKTFMHSNTFAGNPLAAATALATLTILEQDDIYAYVNQHKSLLYQYMQDIADKTGLLTNVRSLGFMAAADLVSTHPRAGFKVYQHALTLGAFLRPLGNTIYWLPPLNMELTTLNELRDITLEAITQAIF
ncbi:MAG: adenosylmethionine--8-amino-7-oxononanoate transaminase [Gammaproteobacteria bacterium]